MDLKQSTAATLEIGPCLDPDGVEYAGLVISDVTLVKNGTPAAMAAAATLTYTDNGNYLLVMTTGNTNTLGSWQVRCNKAGYQFPPLSGMVLSAATYDAIVTNAAGSVGAIPIVGSEMGVNAAGASAIVSAIQSADIPLVRYSNVDAEGRIFVTQNADHYATDGFGLEITVEGFDGDLSNATSAVLTIASGGVTEPFTMTGAPSTGSGTGSARYTFSFDLPRSQMANLEKGTGTYDMFAVLANGHQVSVLVEQAARIYGRL